VNTTLNGKESTEAFNISIRGLRYNLSQSYPKRVDPDENFTVQGSVKKYIQDGSGGVKKVNYTDERIEIRYRGSDGQLEARSGVTNSSGGFVIGNFTSPLNAGDREVRIFSVNDEGISRLRTENLKTRIRVDNSSSVSPKKRRYQDTGLEKTSFVDPGQDVDFSVETRKSLNFVKNVYANITLPDGSRKRLNLSAENVLGDKLEKEADWDSGKTSHLTHADLQRGITAEKLRIGPQENPSDDLVLDMPMERESGPVRDLSGQGNNATVSGSVNRNTGGVFSTNGTELGGGSLEIEDSSALNLNSNFTVSTWIKTSENGAVYSRASNGGDNINPELRVEEGVPVLEVQNGGNGVILSGSRSVDDGEWHHLTGMYNGTHLAIYVDGERSGSSTYSFGLPQFQRNPVIGDSGTFIGRAFYGKMDNLRIYNHSLPEERIERLSKRQGSIQTDTLNTEKEIRDILKLLNFEGSLNQEEIQVRVESDPDSDGMFEELSEEINLSQGSQIRSVSGLENNSDTFRLNLSFQTSNASRSPVLSRIDLKARKDPKIKWSSSRPVQEFLEGQYGLYKADYGASDYASNFEDTELEESSFKVRDIEVEPGHREKVEPGDTFNVTGNVSIITGDGNGGRSIQDYTGNISLLYEDVVKGKNRINESINLENIGTGDQANIPVNGSQTPQNAEVTFYGQYSGVDEQSIWSNATDWDAFQSRTGTDHSNKRDSDVTNRTLSLGYPNSDLKENSSNLNHYYAMDDSSGPLSDSAGDQGLQTVGSPQLGQEGILNTDSIGFSGTDGFKSSSPIFSSTGSFSINAWVRPHSLPSSSGHLGSGSGDPYTILAVEDSLTVQIVEGGNVYAETNISGTTSNVSTDSGNIDVGKWNMVTLVYDSVDGSLEISTGQGGDFNQITLGADPDLTTGNAYIGYRPDIGGNGFRGDIDELRIYGRTANPFNLRNRAGDKNEQQELTTGLKSFSETVRTESLVLEAETDTMNQSAEVKVISSEGGDSDPIPLDEDQTRYEITGSMLDSQDFRLNVQMESNVTDAPIIEKLRLVRRYATEDPGLDIDGDGEQEANYSGRITPGNSQTKKLDNLSTGTNKASFQTENGKFNAKINYTEVLVENTEPEVPVDENGTFETTFTAPDFSGESNIEYFVTNNNGIQGLNETSVTTSLKFSSSNITDLANGDKTVDPEDRFQINTTLESHGNPIERMWAYIQTPEGNTYERDLNKQEVWKLQENISEIYDAEGEYSFELNAKDSQGLRELNSPELKLQVTNGSVSAIKSDQTVGLGREFELNGTVRQSLSDERVNASVEVKLEETGETDLVSTDESGFYSTSLNAPENTGSFEVNINSTDEDGIRARNTTVVEVEDSTDIEVSVPQNDIPVQGVTLNNGLNKTVPINVTNTGNTEVRGLKVFGEELPKANETDKILEDRGGRDWRTVKQYYNISAGETREVDAVIDVSEASTQADYNLNISTEFNTSGGFNKRSSDPVTLSVTLSKLPLFQQNLSLTYEDGFSGNFISPDGAANLTIENEGTGTATGIGWTVSSDRFNKSWIDGFFRAKDGGYDRGTGDTVSIFEMNGQIPEGTPPGNYSTLLKSYSDDADETNSANITVEVKDSPKWDPDLRALDEEVQIPDEINASNPVKLGTLELDSREDLFELTLENTGNRELSWDVESQISQGDDDNLFFSNESKVPDHGSESYSSTIDSFSDYEYQISSPPATVGYTTEYATDIPSNYSANISIECTAPSECSPQQINIPVEGTVKDPAPTFSNIEIPEITGNGNNITINGTVSDNAGTTNTEGLKQMNITITKYLDNVEKEIRVGNDDFNIQSPQGDFSDEIKPDKLGRDLPSNDHTYGVRFEAVDENGNRRTSDEYNFTVRDRANIQLDMEQDSVELDDVTANSGDTKTLTGNVMGGRVDVEDVSLTLSIDETDPRAADVDKINFSDRDTFINIGDVSARENKTFDAEIVAAANTEFIPDYFASITPAWNNPDGSSVSGTENTLTASATANIKMNVTGAQTVNIPHGSTENGSLTVKSAGNTRLEDIQFECIGCDSELGITGFSQTGFDLDSGESKTVNYEMSAAEYLQPTTEEIQIKAISERTNKQLNGTTVVVPEQRSVEIEPENDSQTIPANQGNLNITTFSVKNTGNVPLEPLAIDNPRDFEFYLGEDSTDPFEKNIEPGETKNIQVRSDTDQIDPKGTEPYNFSIDPSSSTELDQHNIANMTLFVQDIRFNNTYQNRKQDLVAGDTIKARFNLTRSDQTIGQGNEVDIKLEASGKTLDIPENYNPSTKMWETEFQSPDIKDGIKHTFIYSSTSTEFRSSIEEKTEVSYADVTPPEFVNLTAEPVTENENSSIEVTLKDESQITGEQVTANIITPGQNSVQLELTPNDTTPLSEQESRTWKGEFAQTQEEGLYNVSFESTDVEDNTGQSGSEYFRVFRPLNVEGEAGEPSNQTEIRLVDEGGEVSDSVEPVNNSYNQTIKSGNYSRAEIVVDDDKVANVDSVTGEMINSSPPKFDAEISDDLVNVEQEYLSGFGVISDSFENISGSLSFDYSELKNSIDYQGNLQVLKCEQYNLSKAESCQSSYEAVAGDQTFIDVNSENLYVNNISGFSSYILVEDESSSTDNNLNVNLTGEIGDLSELSDLSDLDSLLEDIASNTEGSNTDSGTGGNFEPPFGGNTDSSNDDSLDEIADQLNESQDDLAIGNSEVTVSLQPGERKSTAISLQNPRDETVEIQLEKTDNIAELVSLENNITMEPGEFRTVRISVNASNNSRLKKFSGFIQIKGPNNERSVPINIDIVSAENRLLDVTIEPTVESFQPGEQARIKISFSNQGFSRAVDAETKIEIVDITDNEVIAKKTQTFAVQTTIDRIISMNIPEDAELGTYEARASVEYSNIPGNRSATAVGQVDLQKPLLDRQTVGIQNRYWLLSIFILIILSSAGGYYYYRKKKIEEKKKRFDEQVDNAELPDETGRTAFVGQLSEIGKRAFLNLEDLKTHCLAAGATGAGKTVAAEVIAEEALEKGVNVIVLDPTGQWSGYLEENEDQQMEAFFGDFGMSESDTRDYTGNIRAVEADQDTVDITDVLRSGEDEGSIHVFSMHKLDNEELEKYLSDTIKQIFEYNPEETDQLQTLIVYDEAHRVLEKFGGTGEGVKQLERGAREFRKWGIGMLLISQVIGDFPEEVRANIGTQVQMRTEYEGDLDRIQRKYGDHISQGVTKSNTGTGMIQNSSYNHGRPYFVDFRPLKHSPEKISDDKLEKFEDYNRRIDKIEDMIDVLDDMGEDVFDYRSRLNLAKKNLRKMSFNLVDTYLEELNNELEDEIDM